MRLRHKKKQNDFFSDFLTLNYHNLYNIKTLLLRPFFATFLVFTTQSYYSLLIKLFILLLYGNNINRFNLLRKHNKFKPTDEFTTKFNYSAVRNLTFVINLLFKFQLKQFYERILYHWLTNNVKHFYDPSLVWPFKI